MLFVGMTDIEGEEVGSEVGCTELVGADVVLLVGAKVGTADG